MSNTPIISPYLNNPFFIAPSSLVPTVSAPDTLRNPREVIFYTVQDSTGRVTRHTASQDATDLVVTIPTSPLDVIHPNHEFQTIRIPIPPNFRPGQTITQNGFSITNVTAPSPPSLNPAAAWPSSSQDLIDTPVLQPLSRPDQRPLTTSASVSTNATTGFVNVNMNDYPLYQPTESFAIQGRREVKNLLQQGNQEFIIPKFLKDNLEIRTKLSLVGKELTIRTQLVLQENEKEIIISEDEDSVDLSDLQDNTY